MALHRVTLAAVIALCAATAARAINITVDYRYDSNGFFTGNAAARTAIEAAAQRFSDIITTSLTAQTLANNSLDPRIGFTHPGNGQDWQVSPATSTANDRIFQITNPQDAAEEYRGPWSIGEDEWILYAGARPLTNAAGQGGTGTGINITTVFTDENSHLNRGFRAVSESGDLPVWGGAVTFDTGRNWHFDLNTAPGSGEIDFYSIAMHEIGHTLGLNTSWDDWEDEQSGDVFQGANAVAAFNAVEGTGLSGLNVVDGTPPAGFAPNNHWEDGTYDSPIFPVADPKLAGTVGLGVPQDLLLEPIANFTGSVRRFELTLVDVAALEDVGWTVIDTIPGDYDFDNDVDAVDYAVWRESLAAPVTNGTFAEWSANLGRTASSTSQSVPEPTTLALLAVAILGARRTSRRRRAGC